MYFESENMPNLAFFFFFQSKCAACNHNLELPTVHFLCQHSYHKHCFQSYSDNESECVYCLNENKKIIDIVKSQQISREQHDTFHRYVYSTSYLVHKIT